MKVAEQIAKLLADRGIAELLGNPGTTELPFLEGVTQRYYLTLHDAIAVGAADGLAQITRGVTMTNLHAAPGLGNSVGFVDTARRNRSPVLITVGQQDLRHADQEPLLYGGLESMVAGLVKYSHEVRAPAEVPEAIDRAFRHALEPPRGPVLLSLPMNVMEAPAEEGLIPRSEPHGLDESVDGVAERIADATKPVIVAGYEVDVDDAFPELAEVARRLGAPVYAEPLASRAPVPAEFPGFAGDLLPASALIDAALGEHDLVLLVGADLTLYPYTAAPLLPGKAVVYLGRDPSVASKFRASHAFGNVKTQLARLLPRLPTGRPEFRAPREFARANRIARAEARMGGSFVFDRALRAFADHTVVDEAVSLTPTLKAAGAYRGKDSYFASRSGQLGWGLAASIGLALRAPRVLVAIGDGALQYSVQALWTLARYRLPVKVLVLNNRSYAILRSYSRAFHTRLTDADYLTVSGVDVEGLAKSYGVPARSVARSPDLDEGLRWLHDSPGPALLNVAVDESVPDLFS